MSCSELYYPMCVDRCQLHLWGSCNASCRRVVGRVIRLRDINPCYERGKQACPTRLGILTRRIEDFRLPISDFGLGNAACLPTCGTAS
jgi:hypothetical protein